MKRVVRMLWPILFLLLAFLHSQTLWSSFLHSAPLCLPKETAALLEFKNTISVDKEDCNDYSRTNSWNESKDCCSWDGVSCHMVTGHIIGINLTHSCLRGTLHANSNLFHLQRLQWLDLSSNRLDGSPLENSSLFQLKGLQRLDLAFNDFNGSISSELFNQSVSLTHLDLSYNSFSSLIPYEIKFLPKLVSLDLSGSFFRFDNQGFVMLAQNLTELRYLILDHINMSDVDLTSFLNLTSSLKHLSLEYCQLNGEFPSEVFRLPYLRYIDLAWNENLTGSLPKANLSSALKSLDLSSCHFRGSIPASLGNLTQLINLDFSNNDFGGQIPDVFGNLDKLTSLTFISCNFSGQLPVTLFNLSQLTYLDLSHNRLEGSLPNHVNELQLLQVLLLFDNLLSGGVPSWLFTLPSLEYLDLSRNKLTGPIDKIQKLSSLQYINLSSNDIHGPIPTSFSLFDLPSLQILDLSSNNLNGVIKSNMLAKLKNLLHLDLSYNSLLSLSGSNSDVNCSSSPLQTLLFSSCTITQFPSFLRTSYYLSHLDLSNNNISGGISKWEAQGWEHLYSLNLSFNFLTTLEQFPGKNLDFIDLRSNLLQGPILSACLNPQVPNPPQFNKLLVSDNKLTGNIPPLICNWSSLLILDLSRNYLSGNILECLGNLSTVEVMSLEMNNFHGKVPDFVGDNRLEYLLFNDNQLEGFLPRSLANCSSLRLLNLRNNKFTGTFPHWLSSLPDLQVLLLRNNRLHGPLPTSSNFSALRIIDLSHNELTGPLPTIFFQNLRAMKDETDDGSWGSVFEGRGWETYYYTPVNVTTKRLEMKLVKTLAIFRSMDFSSNLFCGQIPEALGELISLQALNLSNNNFTRRIPPSVGNMVALESLDLSSNKLGGEIPPQLTNLTFLAVLNLSQNDLVGPIPGGKQFGTFDNDSYSGNSGLCGFPLSKQCGNPEPKPPVPMLKEDEGFEIPFFWKVVMMGYGSGMVLGVSVGYIVLTTGRPWWFIRKVERDWQTNVTKWVRRFRGRRN